MWTKGILGNRAGLPFPLKTSDIIGVFVGAIVGSVYEFNNHRSKDFPLFREGSHFTDDTILTIATADALLYDQQSFQAW